VGGSAEKGEKIMKRLFDNLQKKNQYYNELFKITSGMIYDVQNSGREAEFNMLVGKRMQVIKAIDALDIERKRFISSLREDVQPHIRNLTLGREQPRNAAEKAIYDIVQENRKLLRKIMTYNKNLDMQVKLAMTRSKTE
jgi:hypothetical protein